MNKKTLIALVCLSIVFTLTLLKLSPITKNGNTLGIFDSGAFDYSTSKRCIQMGGYCSSACPPNTPTESYKCYFGYFVGCSIRQRCVVPIDQDQDQPKPIRPTNSMPTSVSYKPTPTAIDVGSTKILPSPPTPITESSGFVSCQTIASLQAKYCGNTPTRSPQPTTTPARSPTTTPTPKIIIPTRSPATTPTVSCGVLGKSCSFNSECCSGYCNSFSYGRYCDDSKNPIPTPAPSGDCYPNQTRCYGDSIQKCNSSGKWYIETYCPEDCVDSKCVAYPIGYKTPTPAPP